MEEQTKKSNTWWIIGLSVLVIIGVGAIIFWVIGGFGNAGPAPEGPEIEVPLPPDPGLPSATASEAINIRSGPGTQYPSYGVAPKGTTGEVIGVSATKQWWVVKVPPTIDPSGQGWVSGQYVQVSNVENVPVIPDPPLPPNVELPMPPIALPSAQALDVIYIRSGPGVQYPAYGLAQKGATGEVIGVSEDGKWWVVKLPTDLVASGQGWVSADWVQTSGTENVPVIPAP
jgi:uncharacterized protein YraI